MEIKTKTKQVTIIFNTKTFEIKDYFAPKQLKDILMMLEELKDKYTDKQINNLFWFAVHSLNYYCCPYGC